MIKKNELLFWSDCGQKGCIVLKHKNRGKITFLSLKRLGIFLFPFLTHDKILRLAGRGEGVPSGQAPSKSLTFGNHSMRQADVENPFCLHVLKDWIHVSSWSRLRLDVEKVEEGREIERLAPLI